MIRPRISSGGSFYHLQSTRSRAEHERKQKNRRRSIPISIHTLCMGRDIDLPTMVIESLVDQLQNQGTLCQSGKASYSNW